MSRSARPERYEVVCELDLTRFDDPRVARRTARRAHAELRRLARRDRRVRSTRLRRGGRERAEISVVVAAVSTNDALRHCGAMLRTAVHAVGGHTPGWDQLVARVSVGTTPPGRGRSADLDPHVRDWADAPSWASVTATAQRRGAIPAALPPLARSSAGVAVIDLRDG